MQSLDLKKLKPDALTKAASEANGKFVRLTGFIRSADEHSLSICSSRTAASYLEFPRSAVIAAFREEKEESRVTLLIAKDAQVSVVSRCEASELSSGSTRGCEPEEVGAAEARPYGSIHPALAKLKAEILKIKGAIGSGAGSRYLKCEEAYHDALRDGTDIDKAQQKRDLCLLGIDEPDDPTDILW